MQFGTPDPPGNDLDSPKGISRSPRSPSVDDFAVPPTSDASHQTLLKEVRSRIDTESLQRITTTAKLTEDYVSEMQKLHRLRKQVEELIPLLCEANLEFRLNADTLVREARDQILDAKRSEMQERANLRIRPPKNIVDAHLLALPPESASAQLVESLDDNVQRFVSDFFAGLHRLVDSEVAGLVEWTSQNTCCYHFFREVVLQESNTVTKEVGRLHRSKDCPGGWDATEETILSSVHQHRIARHEHHTTDAFHTTILDTEVVMPKAVRAFVDHIPDWMAPIVRIVDGKIAREIIVERDLETEHWEQAETKDIPVFGNEPAVIVDNVVLTGWGPREIEAELARQTDSRKVAKTKSPTSFGTTALVCFSFGTVACLSSVSLFARSAQSPIAMTISASIAMLAAPIWFFGFGSLNPRTGRRHAKRRSWIAAIGVSAITIGIGLFVSNATPTPAMSIVRVALLLLGCGLITLPTLLATK